MGIVEYNSPKGKLLKRPALRVTDIDTQVKPYVKEALEVMRKLNGIGIAANQIGQPYSWFLNTMGEIIINPVIIISLPCEEFESLEGCLSLPNKYFKVMRREQITLNYEDVAGNDQNRVLEGIEAVVAQHECDHLDGTLIKDCGIRSYAGEYA